MTLAQRFKGKYSLKFKKKNGKQAGCKISIVPIRLYCCPKEELNLVICRNLGQEPMLLITNLKSDDPRLAVIHISKRIFDTPRFKFYAIADGIFTVFGKAKQGIAHLLRKKPKDPQLSLFNNLGFACG